MGSRVYACSLPRNQNWSTRSCFVFMAHLQQMGPQARGQDFSGETVTWRWDEAAHVDNVARPTATAARQVVGRCRTAGIARSSIRHRAADDKAQALVHHRTLLPLHRHFPLEGGKCYPRVRYVRYLCLGPLIGPFRHIGHRGALAHAGFCSSSTMPSKRKFFFPGNFSSSCLNVSSVMLPMYLSASSGWSTPLKKITLNALPRTMRS